MDFYALWTSSIENVTPYSPQRQVNMIMDRVDEKAARLKLQLM